MPPGAAWEGKTMWWVRCRPSPTAEVVGLDSWEWRGPKDDFKASIRHLYLVEALKQLYIFFPLLWQA